MGFSSGRRKREGEGRPPVASLDL
ncbi:hypothetical protein CCACVL1_09337 [Corchorus capsularis]|uniref:Uncharacterized protein n=1 Tax=Corchorus capsularis TaxID=210143 RepID=A0A1R3IWQ7_COCAP|nr:hypothetical protein CCACVL1_09337 [Corchorus capsularis]